MPTPADKNLALIETKLRFIARQAQQIEGTGRGDFDRVEEIYMAIQSAHRALTEHRLSLAPARELPDTIAPCEAA